MDRKVRFGIMGCGMIASYHADAILEIEGARLVGVFDSNREALEKFCEKYDVQGYESQEMLLGAEDIDVICICLPSGLHYEIAIACTEYKKHVVVEKPMALNVQQCNEIIRSAEKNGVFITVISQLRYSASMEILKKAVDDRALGKIVLADICMRYYRSEAYYAQSKWRGTWKMDGGGALMNQGIHGIDLLQYVMGKVVCVQAISKTLLHSIETEDTLVAILEFENGAIGTVQATTSVYPGFQRELSICGTNGTIVLCEDTIKEWKIKNSEEHYPLSDNVKANMETGSRPDGMDCSLHKKQLADFVDCIKDGRRPFIDGYEGKKAVAIICAIYEAAEKGEKIYIQ